MSFRIRKVLFSQPATSAIAIMVVQRLVVGHEIGMEGRLD